MEKPSMQQQPMETMVGHDVDGALEDDPRENGRYVRFPELSHGSLNAQGEPALNKWSTFITRNHDYPASQVTYTPTFLSRCSAHSQSLGNVVCGRRP